MSPSDLAGRIDGLWRNLFQGEVKQTLADFEFDTDVGQPADAWRAAR